MTVRRLLRIGLNVGDLDRAQDFYVQALGFSPVDEGDDATLARLLGVRRAHTRTLAFGAQLIELAVCDPPGLAYPADGTSADIWFQHFAIAIPDIAVAFERLRGHAHTAISRDGPQHLPQASGGAIAYKFRDPDGHPLELIQFAGDAASNGINHSAISVADPALSIKFYTDLGLLQGSRQVNTGPEQDRLDGLHDVTVDVVAMHPPQQATPHVELLAYRVPHGRAAIIDAPDIVATRLVMQGDVNDEAALIYDPDGHLLMIVPDAGR